MMAVKPPDWACAKTMHLPWHAVTPEGGCLGPLSHDPVGERHRHRHPAVVSSEHRRRRGAREFSTVLDRLMMHDEMTHKVSNP